MPELGSYGSVRGARGNSRPYRESRRGPAKPTRMTHNEHRNQGGGYGPFDLSPIAQLIMSAKCSIKNGIPR
jgi:hypothetical protein